MHSFHISDYEPKSGQLCQTFKGKDNVYPVAQDVNCLISEPLIPDEIILITKSVYHEDLASYYVEFMKDSRLFYTYFYEQVVCFTQDNDFKVITRIDESNRQSTFDYPWVICE